MSSAIVGSQFARFRRADRFFYEEGSDPLTRFTPPQLAEIKKITMSKVLCVTSIFSGQSKSTG